MGGSGVVGGGVGGGRVGGGEAGEPASDHLVCIFIILGSCHSVILSLISSCHLIIRRKTCGWLKRMTREWKAAPQCQLPASQVAVPISKALWQSGTRAPPSPSLPRAQSWASSGCGERGGWRRGRGCLTGGSCSGAGPGSSPLSSSLKGRLTLSSSWQSSLTLTLATEGHGRLNLLK